MIFFFKNENLIIFQTFLLKVSPDLPQHSRHAFSYGSSESFIDQDAKALIKITS
ncbi:hypothetical protein D3C80_573580 [compost metagenome]